MKEGLDGSEVVSELPLEPVGLDWDGQLKPIGQLVFEAPDISEVLINDHRYQVRNIRVWITGPGE